MEVFSEMKMTTEWWESQTLHFHTFLKRDEDLRATDALSPFSGQESKVYASTRIGMHPNASLTLLSLVFSLQLFATNIVYKSAH